MQLSKTEQQLYNKIDEILWNDCDPIGINDEAPRDEYQMYVPQIFSLVINKNDREMVAQKLLSIEKESMGFEGDMDHCRNIATIIFELIQSPKH